MKLKSIKIEKLFDIFDYDIPFENEDNILILTGANGFGKTMILNIIDSLFNQKFDFFEKLVFKKITLSFDDEIIIQIKKENPDHIIFIFQKELKEIHQINYSDFQNEEKINLKKLEKFNNFINLLQFINVYLIIEQRIFKKTPIENNETHETHENNKEQSIIIDNLKIYSNSLKEIMKIVSEISFKKGQELDSSYPVRLRNEKNILNIDAYNFKFNSIKEKQKKIN